MKYTNTGLTSAMRRLDPSLASLQRSMGHKLDQRPGIFPELPRQLNPHATDLSNCTIPLTEHELWQTCAMNYLEVSSTWLFQMCFGTCVKNVLFQYKQAVAVCERVCCWVGRTILMSNYSPIMYFQRVFSAFLDGCNLNLSGLRLRNQNKRKCVTKPHTHTYTHAHELL